MPSSDRTAPSRDRPEHKSAPPDGERAKVDGGPVQPPQYFDPTEPWDAQSAEALTQLYESGEGYLHKRPGDDRPQRPQPEASAMPQGGEPAGLDGAWLEARLADMAERLQQSLAEMNPDKPAEHLNRRLDAIEKRFSEALGRVVQRSDLDGLKLIEAHILELAAHIEQTRSRLDRIDAIDEQMQGLTRRIEEGDIQRLDALEKLLQNYIAEWRESDKRTTSALHNLEGVVDRVGESIEAMEAQKPAPDLALSLLGTTGLSDAAVDSDPLSQAYTDAAHVLEPAHAPRSTLDAADYMPKPEPASDAPQTAAAHEPPMPPAEQRDAKPGGGSLPSPKLRALALRANQRQTEILGAQTDAGDAGKAREPAPAAPAETAGPQSRRSIRPSLLLTGGITLFAAIGYLLVDALMSTPAVPMRPVETKQSARANDIDDMSGPASREHFPVAPSIDRSGQDRPPLKIGRIDAIASVMAAAFRRKETPSTPDDLSPVMATLPMTIGPASLRQAAMRGETAAQLEVAARFAAGRGVERNLQQAFHWYGRAAAQGSAVAQYRLGAFHERGFGTARDTERARAWYTRAAGQGNVNAMHNLAVLSVSGGRPDYAAAAKWFAQAADFGLADSQVNLAILYQKGLGVAKDLAQTYRWLTLAARGGDREAAGRIPQVKSNLSSAEVHAADAAIAAWRPRTPAAEANETAVAVAPDSHG